MTKIEKALAEKILVLDGAMGTMLQAYKFEEDWLRLIRSRPFHRCFKRRERFKDHPSPLKGNNDLLSLIVLLIPTRPLKLLGLMIHRKYFEVGADIVETNTFSSTSIGMADYAMEDVGRSLRTQSAIGKNCFEIEVAEFTQAKTFPHKPRFASLIRF